MPLKIVRNDITKMKVDAIVNAAASDLLGGGGVDGAIHAAAGPELLAECKTLHGCATGESKMTKGYNLPAKYVIHTVGPVWQGGSHGEAALLRASYRNSLAIAVREHFTSIAFPLISSGAFHYPKEEALQIAVGTITEFLARLDHDLRVYLVIFDRKMFQIGSQLYADIASYIDEEYVAAHRDRQERRVLSKYEEMAAPKAAVCGAREAIPEGMSSLDDVLRHMGESFTHMLLRKIDEEGMSDAECYKKANIDRKLFSKIRSKPDYKPSKRTVLALGLALELPLEELEELLRKAGYALSHADKGDVIVEYFVKRKQYDVYVINEALFAFHQRTLGA